MPALLAPAVRRLRHRRLGFWGTVLIDAVSGVGGGMIRDVLAGEVTRGLYRAGDLYASAAALGAATGSLL